MVQVNTNLLAIKGHFFLYNAGTAPLVPYLSTYARQLGFSAYINGIIYTVLPITGLIAKPLFGAIADRYKIQKHLLILFQILTAVSFFAIYYIPASTVDSNVEIECITNIIHMKTCYEDNSTANNCLLERISDSSSITECMIKCHNENNSSFIFNGAVPLSSTLLLDECVHFTLSSLTSQNGMVPVCTAEGIEYDGNNISSDCYVECNDPLVQELLDSMYTGQSNIMTQFILFFLLMIASWVGQAVVVSVADAMCFDILSENGKHTSSYGKQRLWGSVGWGIFSLLTGVLIDTFSKGSAIKNYSVAFLLSLIFMLLDAVCSYFIKFKPTKQASSIFKEVGYLLKNPQILLFFVWTIGVGLCTGLLWQFLFWHIEDVAVQYGCEAQAYTKTIQGFVSAIQTFGGEIPFLFISGPVLDYVGHKNMMSLVLLAYSIRFILYAQLTNPWWILPIELFQGITFGMFYPAMTSYANHIAPPGTETTVQGLVGAIYEGIGASLGSFIGGALYKFHGGWQTFLWFGYGALVFCVLHYIIQYYCPKRQVKITRI